MSFRIGQKRRRRNKRDRERGWPYCYVVTLTSACARKSPLGPLGRAQPALLYSFL